MKQNLPKCHVSEWANRVFKITASLKKKDGGLLRGYFGLCIQTSLLLTSSLLI